MFERNGIALLLAVVLGSDSVITASVEDLRSGEGGVLLTMVNSRIS